MGNMAQINLDLINTDPFLLFFGTFYIVLGCSIFLAVKPWKEFMHLFIEHDALSLVLGVLCLPISLFVIVFYNDWEGLGSVILMVTGYIGLLKALLLLLRPNWMQSFMRIEFVQKWLWLDALSGIVLGTAMLVL